MELLGQDATALGYFFEYGMIWNALIIKLKINQVISYFHFWLLFSIIILSSPKHDEYGNLKSA